MKEAEVWRGEDAKSKKKVRPEWLYIKEREMPTTQLEMLESIRNTLEGILAVLKDSEIVYMRGKGDKNG